MATDPVAAAAGTTAFFISSCLGWGAGEAVVTFVAGVGQVSLHWPNQARLDRVPYCFRKGCAFPYIVLARRVNRHYYFLYIHSSSLQLLRICLRP